MAKILLDDDFFNMDGLEEDQNYLELVIEFLQKYFNIDFAIFLGRGNAQGYLNIFSSKAIFEKKLQKKGMTEVYDSFVISSDASNYCELGFSEEFIGKIDEIHNNGEEVIIPVCISKHKKDKKCMNDFVYIINDIYKETDSNIAKFISGKQYINESNIIEPTKREPLPNSELCVYYKEVQDKEVIGKDENEKKSIYRKVAKEVAMRNTYKYDSKISSMNGIGEKMRRIYKSGNGSKTIYASIDVEHGALEICDSRGRHIDEFTYTGEAQNRQSSDHNINVP